MRRNLNSSIISQVWVISELKVDPNTMLTARQRTFTCFCWAKIIYLPLLRGCVTETNQRAIVHSLSLRHHPINTGINKKTVTGQWREQEQMWEKLLPHSQGDYSIIASFPRNSTQHRYKRVTSSCSSCFWCATLICSLWFCANVVLMFHPKWKQM